MPLLPHFRHSSGDFATTPPVSDDISHPTDDISPPDDPMIQAADDISHNEGLRLSPDDYVRHDWGAMDTKRDAIAYRLWMDNDDYNNDDAFRVADSIVGFLVEADPS